MFAPFSNRVRLDEARITSLSGSPNTQLPFQSQFRMEYAREWGPCVIGIDQAMRGPLSSLGPAVFCGVVIPSIHEMELESAHGSACCFASSLSVNDQERMEQMIQSDSYIAWLLRVIPSEAADGARCSMGVLEHTTAASIIKEAIAAGVDVRGIRVSASCDPMRFRQFLFEAFPMIDDISVYPRIAAISCSENTNTCHCLLPSSPQSLPSSPLSPMSASSPVVPSIICAAGVLAQSARDNLSRHLLYRQRQSPSPPSKSPLSRMTNASRMRSRLTSSASGSFFRNTVAISRSRSSSEENAHTANVRCAAFAGSEYGESQSGLVRDVPSTISQSKSIPIEMYDFFDDDDSSMCGFTSPKRIRVVPCSPPLPAVITSEDSLSSCVPTAATSATTNMPTVSNCVGQINSGKSIDSFESSPFSSSSFFVNSPPFASSCSSASTTVPTFRQMYGLTNPF